MLVPSFLFGSAQEVRANVRKAVTRLKRGETLQELCESSDKIDLADHPESLIWVDTKWVLRPQKSRDYRAVLLTNEIFFASELSFDQRNALREASVSYLSASP